MTTDLARTHYPDAIVARAVVLAAEGHSIRRIESDLAKEFPDEVTPSRDTVRRRARACADLSREEEGDKADDRALPPPREPPESLPAALNFSKKSALCSHKLSPRLSRSANPTIPSRLPYAPPTTATTTAASASSFPR